MNIQLFIYLFPNLIFMEVAVRREYSLVWKGKDPSETTKPFLESGNKEGA